MKAHIPKSFFCFLLAGILTGCTPFRYYFSPEKLSVIPPRPHLTNVEMYYPGELVPGREYLPVAVIEVFSTGLHNSQRLAFELKKRGMEAGVDAIIDIRSVPFSPEHLVVLGFPHRSTQLPDGGLVQPYVGVLSGIGIVYKDRIDYLDQLVHTIEIYRIDPFAEQAEVHGGSVHYDTHGKVSKMVFADQNGKKWFEDYLYPYSLDHLVKEKENWAYKQVDMNPIGRRRHYRIGNWVNKTCTFFFDSHSPNQINEIRIRYPQTGKERMFLFYDEEKQLIRKRIVKSDKTEWEERLSWSPDRRLAETHWFRIEKEQEIPFLRVRYTYYANDDLEALLADEE